MIRNPVARCSSEPERQRRLRFQSQRRSPGPPATVAVRPSLAYPAPTRADLPMWCDAMPATVHIPIRVRTDPPAAATRAGELADAVAAAAGTGGGTRGWWSGGSGRGGPCRSLRRSPGPGSAARPCRATCGTTSRPASARQWRRRSRTPAFQTASRRPRRGRSRRTRARRSTRVGTTTPTGRTRSRATTTTAWRSRSGWRTTPLGGPAALIRSARGRLAKGDRKLLVGLLLGSHPRRGRHPQGGGRRGPALLRRLLRELFDEQAALVAKTLVRDDFQLSLTLARTAPVSTFQGRDRRPRRRLHHGPAFSPPPPGWWTSGSGRPAG